VTAAGLWILAVGAIRIAEPGYVPDEEITAAVTPSISMHGVPTLPSGVLYTRGALFSYLLWLTGQVFGQSLATYRAVSLVLGALAIVLAFRAASSFTSPVAGAITALLLAAFPPYADATTFARPYTAFLAVASVAMVLSRQAVDGRVQGRWFVVSVVACRLLHEFGAALAFLPLAFTLVAPPMSALRSRSRSLFLTATAAIAVLELVLFGLTQASLSWQFTAQEEPALRPLRSMLLPSFIVSRLATPVDALGIALIMAAFGALLIRYIGAPLLAILCTIFGLFFQLGLTAACVAIAAIAVPRRAKSYAIAGVASSLVSAVLWIAYAADASGAVINWPFIRSLLQGSFRYPLGSSSHLAAELPLVIIAAGTATVIAFIKGLGDDLSSEIRALAIWTAFCLIGLTVSGLAIRPRFLLLAYLPLLSLAASGIESGAMTFLRISPVRRNVVAAASVVLLTGALVIDQITYANRAPALRRAPPVSLDSPVNVMICSEELACRYLLGRVDYLFLTTRDDLEHYSAQRLDGRHGLYASAPVLASEAELDALVRKRGSARLAVILFDSGKVEYDEYVRLSRGVSDRYNGRVTSKGDVTIIYFEPQGLDPGAKVRTAQVDALQLQPR